MQLKNSQLVDELVGRWTPSDLARITSLSMTFSEEPLESEVVVQGVLQPRASELVWPNPERPQFLVVFRFIGVSDVCLSHLGPTPTQVLGFYIDDLSSNGLESVRYRVGDYEDGKIHWNCRAVEILSASRIS